MLLVVAPMPVFPANAGNRQRLLTMCAFLRESGFDLDFAYVAHEDQVYRCHDREPPTDMTAMQRYFRKVFLIEPEKPVPLMARGESFDLDAWCPEEASRFTAWYFGRHPETVGLLVNYVFLSKLCEVAPNWIVTLLDTHDRFSDRRAQYRARNMRSSFFHTTSAEEARGLARAEIVIAIQEEEQALFAQMIGREVFVSYPDVKVIRPFGPLKRIRNVGFVGHGNDANLASLRQFIPAFLSQTSLNLAIAGEVSKGLGDFRSNRLQIKGYLETLSDFYDQVDVVVAPMIMGTGLKLKVVEALAHGKPVLGTALAFPGFSAKPGVMQAPDLVGMITTLDSIKDSTDALQALIAESANCFSAYREKASAANLALAEVINARIDAKAPPAAPTQRARDAAALTPSAERGLAGVAVLIATEARYDQHSEPALAYSPARQRWYLDETGEGGEVRIAGHCLHLGPHFSAALAATPESAQALSRQARVVSHIANAQPDWLSPGRITGRSGTQFTLTFTAPGWIGRASAGLRAFLLNGENREAIRIEAITTAFRHGDPDLGSEVSARCGVSSGVPISISGSVPEHQITTARCLVLLARGLWGRVDLELWQEGQP